MFSFRVKIAALIISSLVIVAIVAWYILKPNQPVQNLNAGAGAPIILPKKATASAGQANVSNASAQAANNYFSDDFSQWSVLENYAQGYRLIYPSIFNVNYSGNPLLFTPATGSGSIKATIIGKAVSVTIDSQGANEGEIGLLNKAANLIRNAFEFITSLGYNPSDSAFRLAHDQ